MPGDFIRRHKILAASLGTAAYLGIMGYVVPGVDTGEWNPRRQWENSRLFTEYLDIRGRVTDLDNNNILSSGEKDYIDAFDRRFGLNDISITSAQDLQRAVKIYQDELKERDKRN